MVSVYRFNGRTFRSVKPTFYSQRPPKFNPIHPLNPHKKQLDHDLSKSQNNPPKNIPESISIFQPFLNLFLSLFPFNGNTLSNTHTHSNPLTHPHI